MLTREKVYNGYVGANNCYQVDSRVKTSYNLSCTETDTGTDMDTGRETDTTNFEKCGIRYGKETITNLYINIYKKGHDTYIL